MSHSGVVIDFPTVPELDAAGGQGKNRVVTTESSVFARDEVRAALTQNNRAGTSQFAIKEFNP